MDALASKPAQELRETWQARALAESKDTLARVIMIVLFFGYRDAMPVLLRVVFPNFRDLQRPFLCGHAMIVRTGKVVCDLIDRDGMRRQATLYDSEDDMVRELRDLADKLKLNDADRREMFAAVQQWVVVDLRVDHEGRKLAS